jgi:hypothetical protein
MATNKECEILTGYTTIIGIVILGICVMSNGGCTSKEQREIDKEQKKFERYVKEKSGITAKERGGITAVDEYGNTLLHMAILYDWRWESREVQVAYVKFLVSKGSDVNAKGKNGKTPLHSAVCCQDKKDVCVELAELLVSEGADVNAKDDSGYTALHYAVYYNFAYRGVNCENFDVVKFLVSKGADVNAKNDKGDTPLHYAASYYREPEKQQRKEEIYKYLVSEGADENAKNNEGFSPSTERRASANSVKICEKCKGTKKVECFCVALAKTPLFREQGILPGRHVDTLPSGRVGNAGPCPKCDGKLTHVCPDCF